MADKIKVLFVTTEFYQAGAQRFVYEVDKAIDKNKFDVSILSLIPLNNSKIWNDYYYEKHIALGTKIYFLDDIKTSHIPTIKQRIKRKLLGGTLHTPQTNIRDFVQNFVAVSFWGEYCFPELNNILTAEQKKKCLIHIMSSKYQDENLYRRFDKTKHYHFVSGFGDEEIQFELSEFKEYRHTFFPLSLNIDNKINQWQFSDEPNKRIGIFTRLSSHKPLDPFIYSFHLLLNKFPSSELYIYGSGDPVHEGVYAFVKHLRLEGKVKFMGHQDNIVKSALKDKLDIVWFHGYHGVPGGFAGFDICTSGIPQIFWNFGTASQDERSETFPMFYKLIDFVDRSCKILANKNDAETLSKKQYNYILETRNISNYIKTLEMLYVGLKN